MAKADKLYRECLFSNPNVTEVTARMVSRYVESPFGLYCDLFASPEEQDPIDPYNQLLMERGSEHEEHTIGTDYPEAAEESYETPEDGFMITLEFMARGEHFIHDMPCIYLPAGMRGNPDVLLKTEGSKSTFGQFHYKVVEIKLAKNIKKHHVVQAAYYNRLIGKIQGFEPELFSVQNGQGDTFDYPMAEWEANLDNAIAGVLAIMAGQEVEPCYGSCPSPWETYGNDLAIAKRDISLIAGVGPSIRARMKDAGFVTIDDIQRAVQPSLQKVHGVGPKKANDFKTKAEALVQGVPVKRESSVFAFPTVKTEVFLDLEGTDPRLQEEGLAVCNYLIGVVRREGSRFAYQPFIAHSPDKEREMLMEFCSFIDKLKGDCIIYHWHSYEKTNIRKMLEHYEVDPATCDKVQRKMVDLSPIAVKSYAFPTYGDGLKEIAKHIGYKWRQDDVDALTSIVLYQRYVETRGTDKDSLNMIMKYNEDDCLATMHIKDWLVKNP